MPIKDILLLTDQIQPNGAAGRVALDLAERTGAHLTALALSVDPILPSVLMGPVPVEAIEATRAQSLALARDGLARFQALATTAGIVVEQRLQEALLGGAIDLFSAQCRLTDLVVIGQADPDHPEPLRDQLIEAALFEGVAPTLLVPYAGVTRFAAGKVMIAWDGSRTAARAVRAAMPLLAMAREVVILIVAGPHFAGEPGADLAHLLTRHGLNVTIETIPLSTSGIADTLLNHITDIGFDWVVMGGYGTSRLQEFFFGGVTRDMLKSMTVPVVMAH